MKNEQNISSNTGQFGKAVVNLPKEHPFVVPEGYFEHFPTAVLKIILEEPAFNPSLPKEVPFKVPGDYFENFSGNILDTLKAAENIELELQSIAPSLIPLRKENPFTVPEGYFNNSETRFSVPNRKLVRIFDVQKIVRYAVAACFMGLLFLVYKGEEHSPSMTNQTMMASNTKTSDVSIEAIASYLNESDMQIEAPENTDLASNDANLLVDINKETVNMVLSEISENDIKQFLDQSVNTENNIN